jgi:hypothetical protein
MSERQQAMIAAFADYEWSDPATVGLRHTLIGMPLGTRLLRMIRRPGCWWMWLSTSDYVYGTYLCVYDSGRIERVTVRVDEGDDVIVVRPSDEEIRIMQHE